MTAAVSSAASSAMQFLRLGLGIAICLCWFATPLVHAGYRTSVVTLTTSEQDEIMSAHNSYRAQVQPPASNMQRLVCV